LKYINNIGELARAVAAPYANVTPVEHVYLLVRSRQSRVTWPRQAGATAPLPLAIALFARRGAAVTQRCTQQV
jgi:hypothetical protein